MGKTKETNRSSDADAPRVAVVPDRAQVAAMGGAGEGGARVVDLKPRILLRRGVRLRPLHHQRRERRRAGLALRLHPLPARLSLSQGCPLPARSGQMRPRPSSLSNPTRWRASLVPPCSGLARPRCRSPVAEAVPSLPARWSP